MSNYSQTTFFGPKDALNSGDPNKVIHGTQVDTELANIATAIASKYDSTSIAGATIKFGDGTSVAPSIAFNNETNTGLYRPAADTIGIAVNGTEVASIAATVLTLLGSVGLAVGGNATVGGTLGVTGAVTGGTYNGQTISAAASLTGSLAVAGALTVSTGGSSIKGGLTIPAPGSGTALAVTGLSGQLAITAAAGPIEVTNNGAPLYVLNHSGAGVSTIQNDSANNWSIAYGTNVASLNTPIIKWNNTGNVTIMPPSSGVALTVTGLAGARSATFDGVTSSSYVQFNRSGSAVGYVGSADSVISGGASTDFGLVAQGGLSLGTNGSAGRLSINSSGNVTIANPSAGTALTISGSGASITGAVSATTFSGDGSSLTALNASNISSGTLADARLSGNAATMLTSGTVASARVSGSYTGITAIGNATVNDDGGSPQVAGFRGTPQNAQTTNYTAVLADRGKSIQLSGTAGQTVTIPAGVFFAGDVLTITAFSGSNAYTIVQGTGLTLYWAVGDATHTGNRTLTSVGIATIQFQSPTTAVISGSALS